LVWVSIQGKLRGINATWHTPTYDISKENNLFSTSTTWQQESLIYAQQTDVLVFYSNAVTHTFTIIARGKCFENVSPHHALALIKQHIRLQLKQKKNKKKGGYNESSTSQKSSLQQRSP